MNLQHKATSKPKAQQPPWYHRPESAQVTQPIQQPSRLASTEESLFDPSEAERILARTGALQEIHGRLLSEEQIEAIAADLGIQPEFVHLAMEQERAGVLPEPHYAVNRKEVLAPTSQSRRPARFQAAATVRGCILVAAVYAAAEYCGVSGWEVILPLFALPLLMSLALGAMGQSRRWGAISGFAVAMAALTALMTMWLFEGVFFDYVIFLIFAVATASNALAGVAGAQLRRVVFRRQSSNRSNESRRTIIREKTTE